MARHHERGWRGLVAQYQFARSRAGALHSGGVPKTPGACTGLFCSVERSPAATFTSHQNLDARRRAHFLPQHRACARGKVRRGTQCRRTSTTYHRRPRALHLYLRHNRATQGRQHQPRAHHAMEPLVCRHDGGPTGRQNVQLFAHVSQCWWGAGAGRNPGRRWGARDPGKVFRQSLLG